MVPIRASIGGEGGVIEVQLRVPRVPDGILRLDRALQVVQLAVNLERVHAIPGLPRLAAVIDGGKCESRVILPQVLAELAGSWICSSHKVAKVRWRVAMLRQVDVPLLTAELKGG